MNLYEKLLPQRLGAWRLTILAWPSCKNSLDGLGTCPRTIDLCSSTALMRRTRLGGNQAVIFLITFCETYAQISTTRMIDLVGRVDIRKAPGFSHQRSCWIGRKLTISLRRI